MGKEFLEAVVIGVLTGSVYGLFSVGLSLVFGVMRLVNFAYGDLVMVGMYVAYMVSHATHLTIYAALPVAILGAVPAGILIYGVFFRGVDVSNRAHDQLLISLGLSILIENSVVDAFGSTPIGSTDPLSSAAIHIGPLGLPVSQLIAFGLAVTLTVATQWVLARTRVGRALRAVVSDREVAMLLGVRPTRMFGIAFIASVALAGFAGVAQFGYLPATPNAGATLILLAFVCVILGGVGDTRGAFLAGIVVGLIESITTTFWRPNLQDTVVYAVFVAAVLIRPRGLLGTAVE